ncbi:MAG: retroviral-like aspartic protease family protein [Saprospiraceae bacterium]|uniref:Retroviral-like aspartic protease family protein n=1 Tax=Candidatus Opimibacter skivensis TaxID=2982028 RepID=A0A9D7XTM6_9BACT|nr:retroviral-like aspartic protease family protein [Candidatus Opimibacter skivensis]
MKCKFKTLSIILLALFSLSSCERKSGRIKSIHPLSPTSEIEERVKSSGKKTVVKMEKVNGVYQIPAEVDGVKMFFIFDTGASIISISETEANFLYKQGKLTDEDIKGTENFTDANGDLSEGTIIVLKTVRIEDRTLNDIEASVVHNLNAPLLFGQSALEKFGKISIDYQRGEIIFE